LAFGPDWTLTTEQAKILASDAEADDNFGNSVAISGDTVVVGSYNSEPNAISFAGSAYIFTRSGTTWTEQAKLISSNISSGDRFGRSVAIDGDTVVVGSASDDTGVTHAGAAYIFTRSGTTWTEQAVIQASDLDSGDAFGWSVAIYGDTVVVGAPSKDDAPHTSNGVVYIFTREGTTWTQQARILASNKGSSDRFGESVGISGDTIVVGAVDEDTGGLNAGSAYIFTRDGTTWTEQTMLTSLDISADDDFGEFVAIDGDTVIVGARLEDSGGTSAGAAYIFTRSGTTWSQQAKIQPSSIEGGDAFGSSVAIDGDTVVVGARLEDTGGANSGAAYIFTRSGTTWTEQIKIQASDNEAAIGFGFSVAIDGYTAIVGAFDENTGGSDAGAAYIFKAG